MVGTIPRPANGVLVPALIRPSMTMGVSKSAAARNLRRSVIGPKSVKVPRRLPTVVCNCHRE